MRVWLLGTGGATNEVRHQACLLVEWHAGADTGRILLDTTFPRSAWQSRCSPRPAPPLAGPLKWRSISRSSSCRWPEAARWMDPSGVVCPRRVGQSSRNCISVPRKAVVAAVCNARLRSPWLRRRRLGGGQHDEDRQHPVGSITVDGETYAHDVVVRSSGKVEKRKKKLSKKIFGTSHMMSLPEAEFVYEKGSDLLVLGPASTTTCAFRPKQPSSLRARGARFSPSRRLAPSLLSIGQPDAR